MQEVHPITNGLDGGRLLLRQGNNTNDSINNHNYQLLQQHHQQQPPALKCPRCDSLNTKFCYYNNYNLSQPRHFCKNCRRYWTKGGVLRNVPVGGGCRKKSKRSSKPKSSSSSLSSSSNNSKKSAHNSHSSSESSSTPPTVCGGALFQIPEVESFGMSSEIETNLFSGDIGGFMNLTNHNNENEYENENNNKNLTVEEGNGTASFSEYLQNHQGVQELDMGKICGIHQEEDKIGGSIDLMVDPTVRIEDLLQNRGNNVGFTTLDWDLTNNDDHHNSNNNNQRLFEVHESSTVDHHAYWSQSTTVVHHQWSDSNTNHVPPLLP